jgi:hypothetical protein
VTGTELGWWPFVLAPKLAVLLPVHPYARKIVTWSTPQGGCRKIGACHRSLLVWYPKLLDASPEQRRNWRISGAGYGIHWPDPGRGSNCAQRAPLGNATPA